MKLNQEKLKRSLAGKFIGHQLHYYEEIGSTNDEAFLLGLSGAPEGTALNSKQQSAGKGRMKEGLGIHLQAVTFILRLFYGQKLSQPKLRKFPY